jgi:hypothetical protein
MQAQTDHNSEPARIHDITTGRVIVPRFFASREDYVKLCLVTNTVTVTTHEGRILTNCLLLTPRATSEDGFLEMLGIPKAVLAEGDSRAASEINAGWVGGSDVIVFPISGNDYTAAVLPLVYGVDTSRFRMWGEHQRRDRHVTPQSTMEEMVDGQGGYNLWFKTYNGEETVDEIPESGRLGNSPDAQIFAREGRLVSTTRIRVSPDGKLTITLAKKASELDAVKNLENVEDQFGSLSEFDGENSPHIVIDPDSSGDGAAPTIHVDSKDSTVDMTPEKVQIRRKSGVDEIIIDDEGIRVTDHTTGTIVMKDGVIAVTASHNGVIKLNGEAGKILSTKNHPMCIMSGTPFVGSPTELTKG